MFGVPTLVMLVHALQPHLFDLQTTLSVVFLPVMHLLPPLPVMHLLPPLPVMHLLPPQDGALWTIAGDEETTLPFPQDNEVWKLSRNTTDLI